MHDSPSNSQSSFITETLNYHVCLKSMGSQSTYKNTNISNSEKGDGWLWYRNVLVSAGIIFNHRSPFNLKKPMDQHIYQHLTSTMTKYLNN